MSGVFAHVWTVDPGRSAYAAAVGFTRGALVFQWIAPYNTSADTAGLGFSGPLTTSTDANTAIRMLIQPLLRCPSPHETRCHLPSGRLS